MKVDNNNLEVNNNNQENNINSASPNHFNKKWTNNINATNEILSKVVIIAFPVTSSVRISNKEKENKVLEKLKKF